MSLIRTAQLNINLPENFPDIKDPSPLFDGELWHLYGTGGIPSEKSYGVFHATAHKPDGPWMISTVDLQNMLIPDVGDNPSEICAPGVIFDEKTQIFHMFVQTHFSIKGGAIIHLTSKDGINFFTKDTPIISEENTFHSGVYDSQPAIINKKKYLTYTGFMRPGHGNINLLESESWNGPWKRHGVIISHKDVILHHNQQDQNDYEWGLEGSQLIELPNGTILLIAVSFLPVGERGTRQRLFFAVAKKVTGPYHSLGPTLYPSESGWDSGENGHAGVVIFENNLYIYYQAKSKALEKKSWRYGLAKIRIDEFCEYIENHIFKI